MAYFMNAVQRRESGSTCYFEFQQGRFCGKHWQESSMYLEADVFEELSLYDLFSNVLPGFDCYGLTVVKKTQWELLMTAAQEDQRWADSLWELEQWAQGCFQRHSCFTVCGV